MLSYLPEFYNFHFWSIYFDAFECGVLAAFLIYVTRYLPGSNLREDRLTLTRSLKVCSPLWRQSVVGSGSQQKHWVSAHLCGDQEAESCWKQS